MLAASGVPPRRWRHAYVATTEEGPMPDYSRMEQRELLARAHQAVGGSYADLGAQLGCSNRTVARWYAKQSSPGPIALQALARLVHPHDPALAAALAASTGVTLESLGIAASPAQASSASRTLIDAVVCAAADAMDLSPRAVRPALLAALARMRELGLTLEAVEHALTPPAKRAPAKSAKGN